MFKLTKLLDHTFVHIIAQPRSGSTALQEYLKRPWLNEDNTLGKGLIMHRSLSEPFNIDKKSRMKTLPKNIKEQTAQAQLLCHDIHQHPQNYMAMKNLIDDITKFDQHTQDMLYSLPGITVGLYRRNTFDQTCSEFLLSIFKKQYPDQTVGVVKQDQHTSLNKRAFLNRLQHNLQQKKFMHSIAHKFDVMIAYEEIQHQFPEQLSHWKNPPKSHSITNYNDVVAWHDEYMQQAGLHQKFTHKGINFVIDKTNK